MSRRKGVDDGWLGVCGWVNRWKKAWNNLQAHLVAKKHPPVGDGQTHLLQGREDWDGCHRNEMGTFMMKIGRLKRVKKKMKKKMQIKKGIQEEE